MTYDAWCWQKNWIKPGDSGVLRLVEKELCVRHCCQVGAEVQQVHHLSNNQYFVPSLSLFLLHRVLWLPRPSPTVTTESVSLCSLWSASWYFKPDPPPWVTPLSSLSAELSTESWKELKPLWSWSGPSLSASTTSPARGSRPTTPWRYWRLTELHLLSRRRRRRRRSSGRERNVSHYIVQMLYFLVFSCRYVCCFFCFFLWRLRRFFVFLSWSLWDEKSALSLHVKPVWRSWAVICSQTCIFVSSSYWMLTTHLWLIRFLDNVSQSVYLGRFLNASH